MHHACQDKIENLQAQVSALRKMLEDRGCSREYIDSYQYAHVLTRLEKMEPEPEPDWIEP